MRIHWAICLLLMLATVSITWYLRTKDMNFFPEAASSEPVIEQPAPYEFTGPPPPPALPPEALADSEVVAGLDQYKDYLNQPEELSRLFAILHSRSEVDQAYLAGERILEDPNRDENEKREHAVKMITLSADISPYVFDLSETRELEIMLSGIPTDQREGIATELSSLIYNSSGGIITPSFEFTSDAPSMVIKIENSEPFTPLPENANMADITSRLYILLVTEMNKNGVSLPLWQATTPEEFTVALTRYSWSKLLPPPAIEQESEEKE